MKRSGFMTSFELIKLNEQIEKNEITIFRISYCFNCNRDVIIHKKFCSEKCMNEYNNKPTIDKLRDLLRGKK